MRRSLKIIARAWAVFSLALTCSVSLAAAPGAQNPPVPLEIPIDTLQIYNLPLGISEASFRKTKKGEWLKLSISNSSDEQIFGVRYWLLVVDSGNKVRRVIDQSESLKLDANSAKAISLPVPNRWKVSDDDRIFLVLAQVIGRNSIWEVQQAKNALIAYAQGDAYPVPNVVRMLNQVDSPIGFSPIFLRQKP